MTNRFWLILNLIVLVLVQRPTTAVKTLLLDRAIESCFPKPHLLLRPRER